MLIKKKQFSFCKRKKILIFFRSFFIFTGVCAPCTITPNLRWCVRVCVFVPRGTKPVMVCGRGGVTRVWTIFDHQKNVDQKRKRFLFS